MLTYIIKKLSYALLVMLGVVVLVNILFVSLGDPVKLVAGQRTDKKTIDNIRKDLRMDSSAFISFLLYLNDVSPIGTYTNTEIKDLSIKGIFVGNTQKWGIKLPYLRRSTQTKKDVSSILLEALPGTILLAVTALIIASIFGILLGVLAAYKRHTWVDTTAVMSSIIGISAPSFFMGIVIAYVFGYVLHNYTGLNFAGSWLTAQPYQGSQLSIKNLILPAITLGIRPLAIITQLTRSSMLDVLEQDYMRTATAKGLSPKTIILKHGLRNALNPVITAITGWFAELLAGAFFVEYIFGWKGIGKVTVDALEKLDIPVVMGSVLLTALLFVLVNLLADVLYSVVDPRIKLQ